MLDPLLGAMGSPMEPLALELAPLRSATEVAELSVSMAKFPASTPDRAERLYNMLSFRTRTTIADVSSLLDRLHAHAQPFVRLVTDAVQGETVVLIPEVDQCVACGHTEDGAYCQPFWVGEVRARHDVAKPHRPVAHRPHVLLQFHRAASGMVERNGDQCDKIGSPKCGTHASETGTVIYEMKPPSPALPPPCVMT